MTGKPKCDPITELRRMLRSGQDSIQEKESHLAAARIESEPLPSAVRVHPAAYTEVSIFPIDRDFPVLRAVDFPAHRQGVRACDTHHA